MSQGIEGPGSRLGRTLVLWSRAGELYCRIGLGDVPTQCRMVLRGEAAELRNGTLELWRGAGEP